MWCVKTIIFKVEALSMLRAFRKNVARALEMSGALNLHLKPSAEKSRRQTYMVIFHARPHSEQGRKEAKLAAAREISCSVITLRSFSGESGSKS